MEVRILFAAPVKKNTQELQEEAEAILVALIERARTAGTLKGSMSLPELLGQDQDETEYEVENYEDDNPEDWV